GGRCGRRWRLRVLAGAGTVPAGPGRGRATPRGRPAGSGGGSWVGWDGEPDGAAGGGCGCAPAGGQLTHDVQPTPALVVGAEAWCPGSALVADLGQQDRWGEDEADGEVAAGLGGVAVLDRVGGQFRHTQRGVAG